MTTERELIRKLKSALYQSGSSGTTEWIMRTNRLIEEADAYLATPEVDAVTAEMVRVALHLCPSDLSSPEKWRWMSRHISKALTQQQESKT